MIAARDNARTLLYVAIAGVLAAVSGLVLQSLWSYPFADSLFTMQAIDLKAWFVLANRYSNAFHWWRIDPILLVGSLLAGPAGLYSLSIALYTIGSFLLVRDLFSDLAQERALICALLNSAIILLLFGMDTVVLMSLTYLPWQIFAVRRVLLTGSAMSVAGLFVSSLLLALAANQVATIFGVIALLVALFSVDVGYRKRLLLPCLLSLAPAWVITLLVPALPLPDYPYLAHVVPGYNTRIGLNPLIGPEASLNIIDRTYVRTGFIELGILLSLLPFFFSIRLSELSKGAAQRALAVTACLCGIAVALDTAVVSSATNQIAPLASVSRMIPSLSFIALAPVIAACGVNLLMLSLARRNAVFFVTLVLGGFCLLSGAIHSRPALARETKHTPMYELLEYPSEPFGRLVRSPSLAILQQFGVEQIQKVRTMSQQKFVPLIDVPHSLRVSHQQTDTQKLSDGDPTTRWTSGRGGQIGDEWILIQFDDVRAAHGLRLHTGGYHADFPRGVSVYGLDDCSAQASTTNAESLFSSENWQGGLGFTKQGYPYFQGQAVVSMIFPKAFTGRCLIVRQIGKSDNFDWSVTEIDFLAADL